MKIKITLVEQKGTCPCHRGHKVGDTFDFDRERKTVSNGCTRSFSYD